VVVAAQELLGEELADHEAEWVSVHELLEEEGADHTLLEEEVVFMGQAAARLVKNERTETALMEFILSERDESD
jgi:hypothetical protein